MKRITGSSRRKRELLVRRFEVPAPPDTLILMDCSDPVGFEGVPDGLSRMKDTLTETALSVARMQMRGGQPIRLPLYGAHASEFHADRAGTLSLLQEELAYQIFRGGEPFDKVLSEARHMRCQRRHRHHQPPGRAGDGGRRHQVRARVRYYLVTYRPDDESYQALVQQLQHQLVEVCYVTPA